MNDHENPEQKIRRVMKETSPKPRAATKKKKGDEAGSNVIKFSGNSNIVAGGDLNVHMAPARRLKVQVQTGAGTIDARQKAELTSRIRRYIEVNNAVRTSRMTFQAAWSALNGAMGVNSYHELRPDQFPAALKWIRTQTGRIQSMPSAPDKDPKFRSDTIRFIKARSKELGDPDVYRPYALKSFGSQSLAELDNDQLQIVRKWLSNKRM